MYKQWKGLNWKIVFEIIPLKLKMYLFKIVKYIQMRAAGILVKKLVKELWYPSIHL